MVNLALDGVAMRRRLKNFLPIVLIALAVQIVAPIAACWAAGIAASDPLSAAVICHGKGGAAAASQDDQTGAQGVQRGCCALCGVLHTGAPVDPPQTAILFTLLNVMVLRVRIRVEENALADVTPYAEDMKERLRFLPTWKR